MKQLLYLLAFGLLVPSTALAQVDAVVAAQCRDARDFYGCVRAFTTPARRSDDIAPLAGVMGSCEASCAEAKQAPLTCGSSPGIDRSGWWRRVWFCGR